MADGERTQRRVTLEDVARHAKVSRAMVSLVMRDAPGPSESTRQRVQRSARDLGYRPDVRARALAGRSTRLIGVMFGVAGTFHFDLLDGLYASAETERYGLLLSALTRGRDEAKALESLHDYRFDALVMLGPAVDVPQVAGDVPVVVVGWAVDHPHVDVVRTSDEEGMHLAVDHLAGLGHERIAHIDGGDGLVAKSRRTAFVDAMRRHGLSHRARVIRGGETQLEGQRAMREALLGDDAFPTAFIAYNDDVAVAAMAVLDQEGIAVPDEVSLIGWDDSEVAGLSRISLTSVAQRPRELARLAIERLVARCNGARDLTREIVLQPELTVRSSTAPARHP